MGPKGTDRPREAAGGPRLGRSRGRSHKGHVAPEAARGVWPACPGTCSACSPATPCHEEAGAWALGAGKGTRPSRPLLGTHGDRAWGGGSGRAEEADWSESRGPGTGWSTGGTWEQDPESEVCGSHLGGGHTMAHRAAGHPQGPDLAARGRCPGASVSRREPAPAGPAASGRDFLGGALARLLAQAAFGRLGRPRVLPGAGPVLAAYAHGREEPQDSLSFRNFCFSQLQSTYSIVSVSGARHSD